MKLLFLACLEPKTGNHTTAERIRSHIESAGHTCELHHAEEFQSSSDLANLLSQNIQFDGALAIHLFKAGRLLLDIQVPFGIVFGGTDINEDVKVEKRRAVMDNVLLKARFAVAFTEKMKQEAMLYLHSQSSKTYVQPQEWHSENPQNVLVIIGPKIDPVLTDAVEAVVRRTAGVFLAQERSQPELHAAMKRCFAMVNSSISEGMSAAILEAMDLGLPVLARNIPGNTAIVQNEVTGLVYSSPQEFVHQSQRLLSDHQLRARVIRNGKVYVVKHHSLKQERETYQRLVNMLH
ncbi:glycosyltransferase 1 domain-containing protein 1 isoform X2 [Entelurus aequoreus]|uniref:glycosyltransferase 1 domain-containing protein 1 isoform X2 n=1 Tax=Entelurus aequoreus TaxID=161455 RepID=UPI002B1DE914|nr:glycosyltransferase 1 domain-containing protein 1 isoform X2 [Entelurus aequoreus]